MKEVKIEERYHSLTVPGDMYHLQPEVVAARRVNRMETFSKRRQIDFGSVLRGKDNQLNGKAGLEDASSEVAIRPSSEPSQKQNRRGSGIC